MRKVKSYAIALINKKTGKREMRTVNAFTKANAKKKIPTSKYTITWISDD